jgi:hypothetical protein
MLMGDGILFGCRVSDTDDGENKRDGKYGLGYLQMFPFPFDAI